MQTEFTAQSLIKNNLKTFSPTILSSNSPPEIEEMDNCIFVDNFFQSYEQVENSLQSFHTTNCHEINEILYYGEKPAEYFGTCGIVQPIPRDFAVEYVKTLYDCLCEKDYLIPSINSESNELNKVILTSSTEAVLYYEDMIVDKGFNIPCPKGGQYHGTVFLCDDEVDNKKGITFYDFIYDGRSYSSIEDFMLEDDDVKEKIFEILSEFSLASGELSMFKEFTESEYFEPTEYVAAKKNRMVAFKSCFFTGNNFTSGERYTLDCSFNGNFD